MPDSLRTILSPPSQLIDAAPFEKLAPWALLTSLEKSLRTFKERDYYVTSFCESGDLLSQWRGYGNNGGGYAIGIKIKNPNVPLNEDHSYNVIKILYDNTKQDKLLTHFIDGVLNELQSCLSLIGSKRDLDKNPYFAAIFQSANDLLRILTTRLKSPGFMEENEWRFSSGMPTDQVNGVKFRDVKGILSPYIELKIDVPAIEIVSVHCGPTLHPDLSAQSVRMLLAQYSIQYVEVINSNIPFKL